MPYTRLQESLQRTNSPTPPAEAHGILCGLTCGLDNIDEVLMQWLQALEIEAPTTDDFSAWPKTIKQSLQDEAMRFSPLLPEEEVPLDERLRALAAWCNGLLYGLGAAGSELSTLEGDVQEFVQDVSQISRLDDNVDNQPDDYDENDENIEGGAELGSEADYYELVEYLKAGMLLLFDASHQQLFANRSAAKLASLDERLSPGRTDDATFH